MYMYAMMKGIKINIVWRRYKICSCEESIRGLMIQGPVKLRKDAYILKCSKQEQLV